MSKKLDQLLARTEDLIRKGDLTKARQQLRKLTPRQLKLPEDRVRAGNLLRRVSMNKQGLAVLSPLVLTEKVDLAALAEYSILLMRLGGVKESLRRLNEPQVLKAAQSTKGNVFHQLAMARGLCLITQWRGHEAAEEFQKYLRGQWPDYQILIGELNLANAFMTQPQMDPNVLALIESCIRKAKAANQLRVLGNCYELRAQALLRLSRTNEARQDLESAQQILGKERGLGLLMTNKWKAVSDSLDRKSVEPLRAFRIKAQQAGHWESIRSADLEILKIALDEHTYHHLYAGSPLPHYKQLMEKIFHRPPLKQEFRFGAPKGHCFDLTTGRFGPMEGISPGRLPHRILEILMRDFYKPSNLVEIFGELYPDESYDESSIGRVQRVIGRARTEFEAAGIPMTIEEDNQLYRIRLLRPMSILIPVSQPKLSPFDIAWKRLTEEFQIGSHFQAKQLRALLGFSSTKLNLWLSEARSRGLIRTEGTGKKTQHQRLV